MNYGICIFFDATKPNNYASEVYLRFGSDSTNYYEYRQPVRYNPMPPDNPGWDEVSMVFAQLTAIKQQRDSLAAKSLYTVAYRKPGHTYG